MTFRRGENLGLARVERLVGIAFFEADHHFGGFCARNSIVADGLNFAIAHLLHRERFSQLIDVRSLREADVHVGAAFEVDAVR